MLLALLAVALQSAAPPLQVPPLATPWPQGEALTKSVAAASDAFYTLFFDACDAGRLRAMLTPDIEMYHDIRGVRALSADQMIANYVKRCTANRGALTRVRRELVAASREIWPVPGFGAIEQANHDFFESVAGQPERKVEAARYLMLWSFGRDGVWRISRIFSYDHRLE